jgi:hypothetical protein
MNSPGTKKLQMCAATLGVCALLAIGALNALFSHADGQRPLADKTMQVGVTTTLESSPPTAPEVARAVPAIRGPAK